MIKILTSTWLLISVLTFYSCKKDNDSQSNYYLNMNIDNKSFSFSDSLFATKQSIAPQLTIFAYSKASGQLQWLFSDYSAGSYLNTYDTTIKKIIYQFTINAIVGQANNGTYIQTLLRPNPNVLNPISMTITNVNATFMEGTFSGALYNGTVTNSTITNGQFRIPFK